MDHHLMGRFGNHYPVNSSLFQVKQIDLQANIKIVDAPVTNFFTNRIISGSLGQI
jgi:hypothetical protein